MNDIFEEILQDQSEEKKIRLLKILLPIIILIAIIAASLIFAYNWQQNKTKDIQMRLGDILVKTVTDTNTNATSFDFNILTDLIKKDEPKISELAALRQIELKISEKDIIGAKKLLEEIIHNNSYDKVTLSFARIAWLTIMIDKDNLSNDEKEQLENFLRYFESEKQPFFGLGTLFKALWHMKCNQNALAQDTLKTLISHKAISITVKELAQILLSNLSYKGDL